MFIRDGEHMFRTYFINNRGDEQMGGTWNYLDITPLGRQEVWEDSPKGYPQTQTYKWWNWHDSYVEEPRPTRNGSSVGRRRGGVPKRGGREAVSEACTGGSGVRHKLGFWPGRSQRRRPSR